jgi:hypothetical protein
MSDDWDALMAEVRALAEQMEHERQARSAALDPRWASYGRWKMRCHDAWERGRWNQYVREHWSRLAFARYLVATGRLSEQA